MRSAAEKVKDEPWFAAGNWTIVTSEGDWAGLQLSKTNWFNEDGHGIHFETWLSPEVLEQGVIQFQAHVMHSGMTLPGTDKKAGAVSKPVMARHRDEVKSWGYHVPSVGGMGLLNARIPFTADTLEETVVRECARFAPLGDTIDEVLSYVLAGKRVPPMPKADKPTASAADAIWGENLVPGMGDSAWHGAAFPNATVSLHPEPDGSLRVEVGGKVSKNHHATACCAGLAFTAGKTYRGTYDVKAAVPRWMTGNIRQAAEPYLGVGDFKGVTIQTDWQTVTWEFKAVRDVANAVLIFALGKVANTVWLRNVKIRERIE